jgi:hypothetical protein
MFQHKVLYVIYKPLSHVQGKLICECLLISFVFTHQPFAVVYLKCIKHFKSKSIIVKRCGGLQGCEMLRIPHCRDSRLTDGSEVASLPRGCALLLRNIFISVSGIYLGQRLNKL